MLTGFSVPAVFVHNGIHSNLSPFLSHNHYKTLSLNQGGSAIPPLIFKLNHQVTN